MATGRLNSALGQNDSLESRDGLSALQSVASAPPDPADAVAPRRYRAGFAGLLVGPGFGELHAPGRGGQRHGEAGVASDPTKARFLREASLGVPWWSCVATRMRVSVRVQADRVCAANRLRQKWPPRSVRPLEGSPCREGGLSTVGARRRLGAVTCLVTLVQPLRPSVSARCSGSRRAARRAHVAADQPSRVRVGCVRRVAGESRPVLHVGESVGDVGPWCEPIELRGELDRPGVLVERVRTWKVKTNRLPGARSGTAGIFTSWGA